MNRWEELLELVIEKILLVSLVCGFVGLCIYIWKLVLQ